MKYVKCPRCNLNYILEAEEYCDVCKKEMGCKGIGKQRDIEHIYAYVSRVYDDFQLYVNSSNSFCDLKSITFESNCFPEYSNVHVQQLYILRYAYAYAYEYKNMYTELFKHYFFDSHISVTSIGCGNMIDYWALVEALRQDKNDNCIINYIGLDSIDWQYKVNSRIKDNVEFKQTDAIKFFTNIEQLDSDVYFFPKSISEFSSFDFVKLCDCFKNKPITKEKFSLLVSIRPVETWARRDINRVCSLVRAIVSNGFYTEDGLDTYYNDDCAEENINQIDSQVNYPFGIIDILKNLTDRCVKDNKSQTDCAKCNKINRSPILTAKYVQYQLFTFYREEEK